MKRSSTHIAWDYGATNCLDFVIPPAKRKTTLCGKHVQSQSIDNNNPTCKACRKIAEEDALLFEILGKKEDFEPLEPD